MTYPMSLWRKGLLVVCIASLASLAAVGPASAADAAQALLAKHAVLDARLRQNQFMRPVVLDSAETSNQVTGEIYAVITHPFAAVSEALNSPDHWCDVMSLHINTKYCRAIAGPSGPVLKVNIGKKTPENLADAPRVEFNYAAGEVTPLFFNVRLNAKNGPLGTSDYRIELEMAPLANGATFLHLTYSYAMNFSARLAVQAYLATVGSGKVGFTQISASGASAPEYVRGVRALVERNTMRYYLAINSYLESASDPGPAQLDRRLQSWFAAVEMYPRQLHEMERDAYIAMKRDEYLRQQTAD